jgi:hypothetical protein
MTDATFLPVDAPWPRKKNANTVIDTTPNTAAMMRFWQ